MAEHRWRPPQRLVEEDLPRGARHEVVATNHLRHTHRPVVVHDRQLIRRADRLAGDDEVAPELRRSRWRAGPAPGPPRRSARAGPGTARRTGGGRGPGPRRPPRSVPRRCQGRPVPPPPHGGRRRPAQCRRGCRYRGRSRPSVSSVRENPHRCSFVLTGREDLHPSPVPARRGRRVRLGWPRDGRGWRRGLRPGARCGRRRAAPPARRSGTSARAPGADPRWARVRAARQSVLAPGEWSIGRSSHGPLKRGPGAGQPVGHRHAT